MKLSQTVTTTLLLISSVLGDRLEPANVACTTRSLTEACPDDSVVQDELNASCEHLHGIPAAKCYMEYLCEHHNQAAVIDHKQCIDSECPLARHVPPKQCVQAEETADEEEATTTETEKPAEQETEAPEEEVPEEEPQEDTIPEEVPEEEDTPEEETPEEDEELIHEEATVTAPEKEAEKEGSGSSGMATFRTVMTVLVVTGLIGAGLFVYRSHNRQTEEEELNLAPAADSEIA